MTFYQDKGTGDSNPHKIMLISFDMPAILKDRCYNIAQEKESRYLIQTYSQSKTSGIKLLALHGVDKGVDPSAKPEKLKLKMHNISNRTKSSE